MTKIVDSQTKGEAQVRCIFENPGMNNKQVARLVRQLHSGCGSSPHEGGTGEKTVAWYRSHAKKGTLGKALMAVVAEYGGSHMVPSAMVGGNAPRPDNALTIDRMVERLKAAGWSVVTPEPEAEVKLDLGF